MADEKPKSSDTNPYAAALDRLRETVKWLVTVFSGAAGLVLAGTSFSGLGHMEPWEPRLQIAVAGLAAGVMLLLVAVRQIVPLLGPLQIFGSELLEPPTGWWYRCRRRLRLGRQGELAYVRARIRDHAFDLLPPGIASAAEMVEQRQQLSLDMKNAPNKAEYERLRARWDNDNPIYTRVLQYAQFELAYLRFRKRLTELSIVALLALGCLAIYAWAANPKPEKEQTEKEKIVEIRKTAGAAVADCAGPATPPTTLKSVHFAFESPKIAPDEFSSIDAALSALRSRPCEVLLLKAHTDTSGGEGLNADLARQRGQAVRELLMTRGGVSGNRVYLSELPRNDLPRLTPDPVREPANRTVEIWLARPVVRP